jgi:hypothetical protein
MAQGDPAGQYQAGMTLTAAYCAEWRAARRALTMSREQARQFDPTGKSSIPICRTHVKRKIRANRKYFCFPEFKSRLHINPSRPDQRGVS